MYNKDITSLLEKGAKSYASKNYEDAVEYYGEACGKSAELNGKEDEELLYLYGKALFQVAVSKNSLFGGADEQEEKKEETDEQDEELKKGKEKGLFQFSEDIPLAEEDEDEDDEEEEEDEQKEEQEEGSENKEEPQEESKEEEQSDFEIAWEILDLSRSLFQQKYDELIKSSPKIEISEDPESSKDEIIQIIVKLSNIHDLLGEISLETENFKQATEDFKILLKLRELIYNFNSPLISEAHYKLSLALEFNFETDNKPESIDHLKKAIDSIKKRDEKDLELIKELELKLEELSRDPNEQLTLQKEEILKGILGEATKNDKTTNLSNNNAKINDLTSIVKKRKPKQDSNSNKKPKN